ncbi:MAG: hypothetical protein Unbinned4585contig1001_35 [Prokaryotic dsDNA virus sp.]|nr:MAG: hypothetical protein Unbinned4585contig1001_35 [Prokaryotic dsDNA virus sp.]|tara:strand:+ start:1556 stop:2029 length:474 start_codon:yes stop_codon:yes gene_type:complete
MIHAIYGQTITSYLSLLESKIHTSVSNNNLRYLFKFTNDMTKTVKYAYGTIVKKNDRYVKQTIDHNTTENIFSGRVNFKPYGYWSYEVYEVSWIGTVGVNDTNAPNSETEVLTVNNNNGVVKGKVHEGKLYVTETVGSEQIQYTTHTETTTNYLYSN